MRTKIVLIASVVLLTSCLKNKQPKCTIDSPDNKASAAEIAFIQNYLTNNSITATQHSSGLFYNITTAGTGAPVTKQCNIVQVNYVGTLMSNGAQFDATTAATGPRTFGLNQLILGWRLGIPLVKSGGTIKLYIPPSLGYGNQAQSSIPANSYLVFEIGLVNVSE